jgi:hypothetical protein
MTFTRERLHELLPAFYRIRDAELARRAGFLDPTDQESGPVKALLRIIATQLEVLEEDLEQLYDDQFIETCAEWVVPYVGDLVGARGLFEFPDARFSQRALVANTVAARRRKGTAAALEEVARSATGWDTSITEFFQLLATTQYMKHVRGQSLATPDLRKGDLLETIGTPFDGVARTFEARRIASGRGKYNLPNVGLYVWRLAAYPRTAVPPFRLDSHRFCFDLLGRDRRLVTNPDVEAGIAHLATRLNVPEPISRRLLAKDLRADAQALYGRGRSITLIVGGEAVPANEVRVCALDDAGYGLWAQQPGDKYILDPELGRLMTPASRPDPELLVTYHYAFSAPMGGGEYGREDSFAADPATGEPIEPVKSVQGSTGLSVALAGMAHGGAAQIEDNLRYEETLSVAAEGGAAIEIRASDRRCPTVYPSGPIEIHGEEDTEVTLNGLWVVGGQLLVPATLPGGQSNRLRLLRLRHCTLVPEALPSPWLVVHAPGVRVEIEQSIIGAIEAVGGASVVVRDSIVDAGSPAAVAYAGPGDEPGAPLTIENTTVVGKVSTELMRLASNTIFYAELEPFDWWLGPVVAERLQQGCVRFSYLPPGSRVPRPYRCQPAKAADDLRVRPNFTSLRWGDPGYAQLSNRCAREIREGADDQSEMGAFHDVYQPQRLGNLRARIEEYLRFGLEAGVLFAS